MKEECSGLGMTYEEFEAFGRELNQRDPKLWLILTAIMRKTMKCQDLHTDAICKLINELQAAQKQIIDLTDAVIQLQELTRRKKT